MFLVEKLEYVFLHLDFVSSHFEELTPISRRMYATAIANELYQLASQLSIIDEQLETSLSFEDAYLNPSLGDSKSINLKKLLDERLYDESPTKDADINKLIDMFPLNEEDYTFNSNHAERFKAGMRYICSNANLMPRNIVYAINKGVTSIFSHLYSIKQKKLNIKDYQYEDFWYLFLYRDDDLIPESVFNEYDAWKEEHDWRDIQVLKDKRTQEILKLLKSGVFAYDIPPVKRDITNSVVEISEDALEDGTEVPENIKKECARLSKYVTYKDDILCLDYVKLGRYIYKHYESIKEEEGNSLIYFDYILLRIHDDMAECNPKLKKYLRFYEDDELEMIYKNSLEVINSCKSLLKDGVPDDFLSVYLHEAFYNENKHEVQSMLKGQSKYTQICKMLGMIKTTHKAFKLDVSTTDLAKAVAPIVEEQNKGTKKKYPKESSLKRYIDDGASDQISKLSIWTSSYIMDQLADQSERLFVEISRK